MEKELSVEELDSVTAGVPVNNGNVIGRELTVEDLDKIKAGLANFKLGLEENSKAEAFADKREELLAEKARLEEMSQGKGRSL